jgi:Skp family chaperone for outer membrane proteins
LNSIVAGILAIAEKKLEHEVKQKQEAIKKAEAEKLQRQQAAEREKKREEQKREQRKLDGLLAQASNLKRSRELREFIAYVRQVHESKGTSIGVDSELGMYLSWAELQADRLDPTINSPKTILDEVIPDETSFNSYRRW